MTYKLTILAALYKSGEFVQSRLQSIINQTVFDKCNLVILNCQNLHNEYDHYSHLLNRTNITSIEYDTHKYLYDTWNDGINITSSDYIVNANADDQWHPQFAEKCINYLDENPQVSVISTGVLLTNIPNQIWPNWESQGEFPKYIYPASTAGPSPVWRRSLHEKYGLFESCAVIGDALAWERWVAGGEQFNLINEDLVLYYHNPMSLERRQTDSGELFRDRDLRLIRPNQYIKIENDNEKSLDTNER